MAIAQRTAKARLFVGTLQDDPNEQPVPSEDPKITGILEAIGDGHVGMSQLIQRLVLSLSVAGDGWLVGIPKDLIEDAQESEDIETPGNIAPAPKKVDRTPQAAKPGAIGEAGDASMPTLDDMQWKMLSIDEVQFQQGNSVRLKLGPADTESVTCSPDDIYLIRVWRSHPRHWWEADSPVRSSLPVLRELVGLTMHISAQVDSRLAGAGLLIVPETASLAMKKQLGMADDDPRDPFAESLIESMMTPIEDRSNAAAIVPLIATVPDAAAALFQHITFDTGLDTSAKEMRDESIRRLALGLDMPPELLLGTSDSNHWGAWLVQEDVVSAHIEPNLALISDALTTQYLRPVLEANGLTPEQAEKYVVWYDVSELIVRPNKAADAQSLHAAGALSDQALRAANGFDESDAPEIAQDDPVKSAALSLITANPSLMLQPGLKVIAEQPKALMANTAIPDMPQQVAAEADATQQEDAPASNPDPTSTAQPAKNAGSVPTGHPLGKPMETNPAADMRSIVASPTADPYSGRDFRLQPQSRTLSPEEVRAAFVRAAGQDGATFYDGYMEQYGAQPATGALPAEPSVVDLTQRTDLENGTYVSTEAPVVGSLSRALAAAELSEDGIVDLTGLE